MYKEPEKLGRSENMPVQSEQKLTPFKETLNILAYQNALRGRSFWATK